MRIQPSHLLIFMSVALVGIALGAALLRSARYRVLGWLVLGSALAALALLALMQLTGRLGPEQLWFRAPTFYVAAVIVAAAALWWLRRPARPALRYGLPAVVLVGIAVVAVAARLDGRSAPLALLLPTLDAPAPPLSYFDLGSEAGTDKRTLAELHGKVVLLNFWATWCVPCRREMPMLAKMQREHAEEGLVVLYVSLEDPTVLKPFLAAHRFEGIHGRLERAAEYYGAGKIYPLSFLISRDGRVAHRWSGRPREDWLAAQIAGQL